MPNVLCGSYGQFAHANDILHVPIYASRGEHVYEGFHIQNVNAYAGRLKDWLRRFRGVATKYLPSYLGWRRIIEREGENLTARGIMRKYPTCVLGEEP